MLDRTREELIKLNKMIKIDSANTELSSEKSDKLQLYSSSSASQMEKTSKILLFSRKSKWGVIGSSIKYSTRPNFLNNNTPKTKHSCSKSSLTRKQLVSRENMMPGDCRQYAQIKTSQKPRIRLPFLEIQPK